MHWRPHTESWSRQEQCLDSNILPCLLTPACQLHAKLLSVCGHPKLYWFSGLSRLSGLLRFFFGLKRSYPAISHQNPWFPMFIPIIVSYNYYIHYYGLSGFLDHSFFVLCRLSRWLTFFFGLDIFLFFSFQSKTPSSHVNHINVS